MHVVACMKHTVDLQQIRIKGDTREPVLEGLPLVFGDMDKNALEEAVRIKEKHGAKVTVLSVGTAKLKEGILEALAMGADEACIIVDPACQGSEPNSTAMVLAEAIKKMGAVDVIFVGEGSADNYSGQIGSRLAEALKIPLITYVRELSIDSDTVKATRDRESALEVVKVKAPVVVSVTSEINKPRRAPLTQILRASRKPLSIWSLKELELDANVVKSASSAIQVISNVAPEQERKGIIFEGELDDSVEKLVSALKKEGALL